jgi:hypothetical protein
MASKADTEILRLWQQQASEEQMMPLDDIRTKAERLDTTTRRWRVVTAVVFILLLIKGAFEVWMETETLERAGDLLLMAALVYVAYRYRTLRLAAPPVALGRTNCREFYRTALLRQHDLSKNSWGFLLHRVGRGQQRVRGVVVPRRAPGSRMDPGRAHAPGRPLADRAPLLQRRALQSVQLSVPGQHRAGRGRPRRPVALAAGWGVARVLWLSLRRSRLAPGHP